MFDSQSQDALRRPFKIASVTHLAHEGRWNIDSPRSYLVPVLFWFTSGQGRFVLEGTVRGYTAHNAIFLPANTAHACDIVGRAHGTAIFFGGMNNLPLPNFGFHLRVHEIQQQGELNQLVDAMQATAADRRPFRDEMLYHQAALTLLWLIREVDSDPNVVCFPGDAQPSPPSEDETTPLKRPGQA